MVYSTYILKAIPQNPLFRFSLKCLVLFPMLQLVEQVATLQCHVK